MKTRHLLATGAIAALVVASAQGATVVTSNSTSTYGDLQGVAIDFDATVKTAANWDPDLVVATVYSIDSVAFRVNSGHAKAPKGTTLYLGVYKGFDTSTGALSGFEGVSTNTVTIPDSGINSLEWTFSGMTVTPEENPGSGGDQRYFMFQTGTDALTDVGTLDVPLMRASSSYANHLSAVLRETYYLVGNRNPDYTATITEVPEPSTFTILGVVLGLGLLRRRK